MEIDKTTLNDLSVFNTEEEFSIVNKIDFTRTTGGREQLRINFHHPLKSIEAIKGIQQTLQFIHLHKAQWPDKITNGTIMMIYKFYETIVDEIPAHPSTASTYTYKFLHGPDFSLVKYSAGHCFDFVQGMSQLVEHFNTPETPAPLKYMLDNVAKSIDKEQLLIIKEKATAGEMSNAAMLHFANFIRYHYKQHIFELLDIYAQLDAWYGMSAAVYHFNLVFPEFVDQEEPTVQATGLYHILLPKPVAYNITLNRDNNFLFLTGANMAGKSTFIKSVGAAVFLAHLGMGVPAEKLQCTLFDGMLSNINVVDNIVKGESYFYNEVQRIKNTILKINDGRKWLILIDELFKGTNVQDAMKCSTTVIEGLIKIKNSLFILSTHLYEIGETLKHYPNIAFKYFETTVADEQLEFSYQLKDGISNDRLGYLILKREKVLELLEKL